MWTICCSPNMLHAAICASIYTISSSWFQPPARLPTLYLYFWCDDSQAKEYGRHWKGQTSVCPAEKLCAAYWQAYSIRACSWGRINDRWSRRSLFRFCSLWYIKFIKGLFFVVVYEKNSPRYLWLQTLYAIQPALEYRQKNLRR